MHPQFTLPDLPIPANVNPAWLHRYARRFGYTDWSSYFWSRIGPRTGPLGCRPWVGSVNWCGYGLVSFARQQYFAHRIAWTLAYGPIPEGLSCLHHCDNPPCCNPTHLWLGTQTRNMQDAASKGRSGPQQHPTSYTGDKNGMSKARHPEKIRRGEQIHNAVATEATVRRMRELHDNNGLSSRELADMFGMSLGGIKHILSRSTWKNVK